MNEPLAKAIITIANPFLKMFKPQLTKLKAGDKAPNFKGIDQHGNEIKLADFKGKKLVLYFYPTDDTPGCTAQACNLRDNYKAFQKKGYEIVGVSKDSEKSHQKFIKKYSLPFPLIADTDFKINEAYDVWHEKKFMGRTFIGTVRTTFIIDEKGKIEKVLTDIDTTNHTEQILD